MTAPAEAGPQLPADWQRWPPRAKARLLEALRTRKLARVWWANARPDQRPPARWRRVWYVRGGRGSGKTWTGSNTLAQLIRENLYDKDGTPTEWAVIAPTYADARDTCIEGRSGLLRAFGLTKRYAGWNRSMGQLTLPTGQMVYVGSADDGALRVQGKNLSGCWCDEVGLWKRWQTAWDESIRYAVRIAPAKIVATGTPKRGRPARVLVRRLLSDPAVVSTRLRTVDNAENLDAEALADLQTMAGTELGRQELEGELLEDAEGALWRLAQFDVPGFRVAAADLPDLQRVVVAIDPAASTGATSDATGIVVAGRGYQLDARHSDRRPRGYVLHSELLRAGAEARMRRAVELYYRHKADAVVIEANNGGDWLPAVLAQVDPNVPYVLVHATRGKRTRAEPVAYLYEDQQRRVHHVGDSVEHVDLEEQMVTWTDAPGEDSPDVMDALVWALTDLLVDGASNTTQSKARDRRLAGRR